MGILGHGVLSLFIEFKERCSYFATFKIGPFQFYMSLKNTGCFFKCFSLPVILKSSYLKIEERIVMKSQEAANI